MIHIPTGFQEVRRGDSFAFARPFALEWVTSTLRSGLTLYETAERHEGAIRLEGRGAVYVISTPAGKWVVRRYRRGGAMRFLGERYVRGKEARPLREARVSVAVIERGVPTPDVVAGAIYREGPFYRADLVTEFASGTADLGWILFSSDSPRERRNSAIEAAGHLLVDTAHAGIEHPDLNAKNVLIEVDRGGRTALLVDLDRMNLDRQIRPLDPARMLSRLERSLWKLGARSSRPLPASEWRLLRAAVAERTEAANSGAVSPVHTEG